MAVGFLRLTLSRAVMVHRGCKSLGSLLLCKNPRSTLPMLSHLGSTLYQLVWLSTATSDSSGPEETEPPEKKKKKKKQDPKSRTTIGSVGRKIHHHHLLLLDEHGVNMGIMHRADALRLMDEKGLKLVQVNEYAEPPVFRLMSGKQIHEEQMRLREKQKAKISGGWQAVPPRQSWICFPFHMQRLLPSLVKWNCMRRVQHGFSNVMVGSHSHTVWSHTDVHPTVQGRIYRLQTTIKVLPQILTSIVSRSLSHVVPTGAGHL